MTDDVELALPPPRQEQVLSKAKKGDAERERKSECGNERKRKAIQHIDWHGICSIYTLTP